ncbi:MAG: lysylphosphatidylglycerol synthase transmembrane domain-containing protein [Bacteroidota bacterium]|nr:lysylphosphatidylglycerol synthase transmembrane domain-containing protein [Bacteroidota bacterium]
MKRKKKISPFLIFRLLGIILFVVILSHMNIAKIAHDLKDLDINFFIYGILFQILVLVFKGIRWHAMNDGRMQKQFWIRSFGRFFESYAIGVVTPGRLGELIKAGHEENKNDKVNTFIRVVSERGFDVSIFVLVAVAALFFGEFIRLETWLNWLFLSGGLFLLVMSYLLLSSRKTLLLLQNLVNRLPGRFSSIEIQGKQYPEGRVSIILLLSILSNFSYFISCYFLAKSVLLDIPLIDVSAGVALAGLLNMLPITIMGLGTRELIFLGIFSSFAQSSVLAFSISVLLVAQFGGGILSMIFGQIFLAADKKRRKEIENE